jgi:hypothetical protein
LATTEVVVVEIRPSARKHGISDDDIRHAIDVAGAEAEAIVDEFDAGSDYVVTGTDALAELRAAGAARREADGRIEAAAIQAYRDGA